LSNGQFHCLRNNPRPVLLQPRFHLPVETDQRNPHAVVAALPHQRSAELLCDRFRRQIVVQAEVALVERFAAQARQQRRRIVLGRENQRCRILLRLRSRACNLTGGKVVDGEHLPRRLHVTELRPRQFVTHGPRRQHRRVGIKFLELRNAGLVHANHVHVRQVVFRREPIRWIHEEPGNKRRGGQQRQSIPVGRAAVQRVNGQQQDQRIHGQKITRKQCAAQHAEQCGVSEQKSKDAQQHERIERRPVVSLGIDTRVQQQCGQGHHHRHKKIHVRRQVQDAMPERRQNSQRCQRRLRVVAQKPRIAEEKPGLRVVVCIPCGQRHNATREPRGLAPEPPAHRACAPESRGQVYRDQGQRNHDRRLL